MDYTNIKFPNMIDNKIDKKYIYGSQSSINGMCHIGITSYMMNSEGMHISLDLEYIDPITEICRTYTESSYEARSYPNYYETVLSRNNSMMYYDINGYVPTNTSTSIKHELIVSGLYKKFGIHICDFTDNITYTPTIYVRLPELPVIETNCNSSGNLLSGIKIFNDTSTQIDVVLIVPYGPKVINSAILGNRLTLKDLVFESDECYYSDICRCLNYSTGNIKVMTISLL